MRFNDMIKRQRLKKYRDETVVKRPFEEITINGHTLKCVHGEVQLPRGLVPVVVEKG